MDENNSTGRKFSYVLIVLTSVFLFSVKVVTAAKSQKTISIYYGAYVGDHLDTLTAVNAFEINAQKGLSIVMWYQGWGATDSTKYFQTSWMDNVRKHGSIPMITWEPWDYTKGINQSPFSLSAIINGNFDSYIAQWAKDSKAWGHPYFLRFAHEMNGNWYPWSEQVNGNSAGQYIQAWKHVRGIFNENGVTNVTWVWSPNVVGPNTTTLQSLYPGDNYVDWVGMDGYNFGTSQSWSRWTSLTNVFLETYRQISGITSKPMMISETASTETGGNKAKWISSSYGSEITSNLPRVKAILWFNQNRETDWRIESSLSSTNAFANAVSQAKFMSNYYSDLNSSPIPTP